MPTAAPAITASDVAAVRDAIGFASRGRPKEATDAQQRITDPTARKLVEWAILRSGNNGADFARFQSFIAANPSWPNIAMFRRRAEALLWEGHAELATIRALTGDKPVSAKGRFALGRALLARATAPAPKPSSAMLGAPNHAVRRRGGDSRNVRRPRHPGRRQGPHGALALCERHQYCATRGDPPWRQ
jgi:hypothetical protein